MKRLIVCSVSMLFLITGCNVNDDLTEEKVKEESYTREITEEEKGYIQLILDHDYEELQKQTTNNNGEELKSDYVYLRIAFQNQKELQADIIELNKKKDNESLFDGKSESQIASGYRSILTNIKQVKYVPKELESEVNKLNELATEREKYYSEIADLEKAQKEAELNTDNPPKTVTIGMTTEEVLTNGWGKPQKINRTTTANGVSEQWIYGYNYLYFEDGILVTIQN